MEGKVNIGYGNIYLIPFKNAAFELDTDNQVVIRPASDIDSETDNVLTYGKNTKTLITAGGAKIIYTLPNEESGMLKFSVLNPLTDALTLRLFPDASQIIDSTDSTKKKIIIKDIPGLNLTTFDKMVKLIFKPITASGEAGANEWITLPRVVLIPRTEETRGKEHSSTEITAMSVGGYDIGFEPEYTGSVDLSSAVDLSDGSDPAYAFDLSIDGEDYTVELGTSATTNSASIVSAINTEVGATVASIVSGKLKIKATEKGGSLTIAAPTGSFDNAIAKILTATTPPITVVGLAEGEIATVIRGDETATAD